MYSISYILLHLMHNHALLGARRRTPLLIETLLVSAVGAYGYRQLKRRIASLETQLQALESRSGPPEAAGVSAISAAALPVEEGEEELEPELELAWRSAPALCEAPLLPPPRATADSVMGILWRNPFASLGALLVLASVGFLFSLLAASDVLPPAVRVLLVALAGGGAFFYGLRQESRRPDWAANLQGGALAIEFLCVLWAYQGYELITAPMAFVWLGGLSTVAVCWATYKRRGLFAFIGVAGALVTPVVASTGASEFSWLALYSAGVSALALGAAVRLRFPSLASASLAGVSLLLGAGVDGAAGYPVVTLVALTAQMVGYSGVALHWTRQPRLRTARQQASIVAVLLGVPLAMAGFMYGMAGLPAGQAALVAGTASLVYLGGISGTAAQWKGWVLAIGSGLGIVALGIGLEGASRAMAVSASAMGLVMLARAVEKPWAGAVALAYWAISVALGYDALTTGQALPLVIAGLVAVGAGFASRGSKLSVVYTVLAPFVLFDAAFHVVDASQAARLSWFLGWAAMVLLVSPPLAAKRVHWPALRLSAAWLLPAGWITLCLPDFGPSGLDIAAREVALACWLALSSFLVWSLCHQGKLPLWWAPRAAAWSQATLLMPVVLSVELCQLLQYYQWSVSSQGAVLALLWSGWCALALSACRKTGLEFRMVWAGAVGAALIASTALLAEPTFAAELLIVASVGLLWRSARRAKTQAAHPQPELLARIVYGVAASAGLGALLREIGSVYGEHGPAVALMVTPSMQPWVSLFWAAAGISLVAYAANVRSRKLWLAGGVVVVLLLLKMLLVDLATLTLAAKVMVFLITGLAFIALGRFSPNPPAPKTAPAGTESPQG